MRRNGDRGKVGGDREILDRGYGFHRTGDRWLSDRWLGMPSSGSVIPPPVGLNDADPVATWLDSSINGNNAMANGTARPIFKTNVLNGKPVVRYVDPQTMLLSSIISGGGQVYGRFWTSFVVMKQAAGQNLYALNNPAGVYTLFERSDGYTLVSSADVSAYVPPASYGSAFHVFATQSFSAVDGFCQFWVDGTRVPMVPQGQVGGDYTQLGAGSGDIAEVIHYNKQLSAADIANISKYLGAKYGLTVAGGGTAVQPDAVYGLRAWWQADSLLTNTPVIPFKPESIPGLKGYWAADSMSLTDGTPVDLWASSGGISNNATQVGAARPVFVNNVLNRDVKLRRLIPLIALGVLDNFEGIYAEAPEEFTLGKPAVRFSAAASQNLVVATGIPDTTWTVIAVMRGLSGLYISIGCDVNYGTVGPFWGFGSWQMGTLGLGYATAGPGADTLFHVVATDTTVSKVHLDGAVWPLTYGTGYGGGPVLNRIGQRYAQYGDQDIAELLVYDSVLSDANRNKVSNYLAHKYGL